MRKFAATKATQSVRLGSGPVVRHNVVISALLVWFKFEFTEQQLDAMAGRGGEEPGAVLATRICVGIVGADNVAACTCDVVRATALLAVVLVLVQHEAVVTGASVRADRVGTDMLASAIVDRAFVLVYII